MVLRRSGSHALELFYANLDRGYALIILEMWDCLSSHLPCFLSLHFKIWEDNTVRKV